MDIQDRIKALEREKELIEELVELYEKLSAYRQPQQPIYVPYPQPCYPCYPIITCSDSTTAS